MDSQLSTQSTDYLVARKKRQRKTETVPHPLLLMDQIRNRVCPVRDWESKSILLPEKIGCPATNRK